MTQCENILEDVDTKDKLVKVYSDQEKLMNILVEIRQSIEKYEGEENSENLKLDKEEEKIIEKLGEYK